MLDMKRWKELRAMTDDERRVIAEGLGLQWPIPITGIVLAESMPLLTRSEPAVTYHGDVPFDQLDPKTQAALGRMIELAIKQAERGEIADESEGDE